jgi:hypothetical protein
LTGAAFYCMSSEVYFLGAAALVNSLRLTGHEEPIHVLDCGLRPEQRELLAPHVTLVDAPGDTPPFLLKTVAPREHPADTMVLIDADMIVTRSLEPLVAEAASGGVVAVRNDSDRFVDEWSELLGLGPARRTTYVSSGLILLGGDTGREVLELLADRQGRIEFDRSYFGSATDVDYPFLYLDQDVLNAIIGARVEPDCFRAIDNRLAPNPPYEGLRLLDESTLRCAYDDGTEPYLLHQYVRKPWLEPTLDTAYSKLLRRLLTGPGVAVEVPDEMIPAHVRGGIGGGVARGVGTTRTWLRWHLPDKLPDAIGSRMKALFERRDAKAER